MPSLCCVETTNESPLGLDYFLSCTILYCSTIPLVLLPHKLGGLFIHRFILAKSITTHVEVLPKVRKIRKLALLSEDLDKEARLSWHAREPRTSSIRWDREERGSIGTASSIGDLSHLSLDFRPL